MTEEEKQEIIDELEKRFEHKYKGYIFKEDISSVFKKTREKWFKGENGSACGSKMAEAFDNSIISWQVWETIRKLTCVICGKQYVRHLKEQNNPDEVAERLCELVYSLRNERKEQE